MSPLEQQIHELKLKQAKADLLKFFWTAIETTPLTEAQREVSEEVLFDLRALFTGRIETIESGKETQNESSQAQSFLFSADEVEVLKELAARAKSRVQAAGPAAPADTKGAFADDDAPATPPPPKKDPNAAIKGDKIRFVLAHRHLDQKRVRINTKQGSVRGTVVGIDAPHIIVKTETGHTIPVDLDNLVVE